MILSQLAHDLLQVGRLCGGILLEFLRVEIGAGAVFHGLLPEIVSQCLCRGEVFVVDDIVECAAGKVSEERSRGVRFVLHALDDIQQWVVPVVLKAVGNHANIHQTVGLHDDKPWRDGVSPRLTPQQVELHAFAQDGCEIFHVRVLRVLGIVYGHLALLPVFVHHDTDGILVPCRDDTSLVGRVAPDGAGVLLSVLRQSGDEVVGHSRGKHPADECGQCHEVMVQVFGRDLRRSVAVAPHLPEGIGLAGGQMELSDERLYLRVEVAKSISGVSECLGTYEHQCLVHHLVDDVGLRHLAVLDVRNAREKLFGSDVRVHEATTVVIRCYLLAASAASHSMSFFFSSLPQWYSPVVPSLCITLWHGMSMAMGFCATADATALTADGFSMRLAMS